MGKFEAHLHHALVLLGRVAVGIAILVGVALAVGWARKSGF